MSKIIRLIALIALSSSFVACGSSTTINQTVVGGYCEVAEDCPCPTDSDYEAECVSNMCICTETEIVETIVEVGCETNEDCECGTGPTGPYEPLCQESGVCFCHELNQECYLLVRSEFFYKLVRELPFFKDFVPPTTPTFSDVPTDHEHYAAIEAATQIGLVNADFDEFRPDDNLNRAEDTKAVVMAIEAEIINPDEETYLDVDFDSWFFQYVETATDLGLTQGYVHQDGTPTGFFGPGDTASSCFMNEMLVEAGFQELL